MDVDNKNKGVNVGSHKGRIILLGDGTEGVLTDSDDAEMVDNSTEEDKDLASQVPKAGAAGVPDKLVTDKDATDGSEQSSKTEADIPDKKQSTTGGED